MSEPVPVDLVAWMESNSRKLTLLEDECYTLRRRNEKLERVAEAARMRRWALLDAEALIDKALSELDKEDA